tara:strand:+ start:365 stop:490 length:126 start_codon:yes stop_codon:yes gene_type:complete
MEGTAVTGAKKRAVTQTSTTEEFIEVDELDACHVPWSQHVN